MLKVENITVVDGDTIRGNIRMPFNIVLENQIIRLSGIDTPESRTSDPIEKLFGMAAKKRLNELVVDGVYISGKNSTKDKYGRILANLMLSNSISINDTLILERLAVAYDGKSKDEIKLIHQENRDYLVKKGVVKYE